MMVDDTISRQAAIDVLGKIFPADPMRNDYTKGITCGAALATEYIKQLPSAEPQITECEHCLAYDPFENGVDGFCRKMGKVMCVSDFCSYAERRKRNDRE